MQLLRQTVPQNCGTHNNKIVIFQRSVCLFYLKKNNNRNAETNLLHILFEVKACFMWGLFLLSHLIIQYVFFTRLFSFSQVIYIDAMQLNWQSSSAAYIWYYFQFVLTVAMSVYWCPTRFLYWMMFLARSSTPNDATRRTGTVHARFWGWVHVARSLAVCEVCFLLVLLLLATVLSVIFRLTASGYTFGMFTIFFLKIC